MIRHNTVVDKSVGDKSRRRRCRSSVWTTNARLFGCRRARSVYRSRGIAPVRCHRAFLYSRKNAIFAVFEYCQRACSNARTAASRVLFIHTERRLATAARARLECYNYIAARRRAVASGIRFENFRPAAFLFYFFLSSPSPRPNVCSSRLLEAHDRKQLSSRRVFAQHSVIGLRTRRERWTPNRFWSLPVKWPNGKCTRISTWRTAYCARSTYVTTSDPVNRLFRSRTPLGHVATYAVFLFAQVHWFFLASTRSPVGCPPCWSSLPAACSAPRCSANLLWHRSKTLNSSSSLRSSGK